VYVLSKGSHNFSDAERFGELVFLDISPLARWDTNRLYLELMEGLKDATEDDLIVVSHLASHCCVATAIMIEWYGRVNLLIYRKDKYEENKLITDHGDNE
jgi:hypothetical protein